MDEYKARLPIGGSWKKSPYKRTLIPLNGICALWGRMACKRSSINKRHFKSIIDFSLTIRNQQLLKSSCKACNVAADKSIC
jgi:hypothetical protein